MYNINEITKEISLFMNVLFTTMNICSFCLFACYDIGDMLYFLSFHEIVLTSSFLKMYKVQSKDYILALVVTNK